MNGLLPLVLALATQIPIYGKEDLELMHFNPAGDYVLMNDIVVGDWDPVGAEHHSFTGTFDGRGFSLIDVNIDQPASDSVGVFGWTRNAYIRRVNVVNAQITGAEGVGILVGYVDEGCTLRDCTVNGQVSGQSWVGGLAGFVEESRIIDCHAIEIDLWAQFYKSGGLIGVIEGPPGSLVAGCSASGHVGAVYSFCSGLIGLSQASEIRQCFSTVVVEPVNAGAAGGLFGQMWGGSLADSYFGGIVDGGAQQLGGLSGGITAAAITRCHSYGFVGQEPVYDGALVGYVFGFSSIDNSYWNVDTSNQTSACSPVFDCDGAKGLTDAQMQNQAHFMGWDFERIWQIDSGYPTLAPLCFDDLDADGQTGITDLLLLLANWGDPYGQIDLLTLLGNWGACPSEEAGAKPGGKKPRRGLSVR